VSAMWFPGARSHSLLRCSCSTTKSIIFKFLDGWLGGASSPSSAMPEITTGRSMWGAMAEFWIGEIDKGKLVEWFVFAHPSQTQGLSPG